MKRLISAVTAVIMLFGIASCSGRGSGKAISYPVDASPATLDPQYAADTGAKLIINNIFEGLVRLDADGNVIPGIAEKWDISEDGLTYTFHLQSATEWYCPSTLKKEYGDEFYDKFSSETVKAADFVFACRRTADPQTASPLAHRLGVLTNSAEVFAGKMPPEALGVEAADDQTLVFTLSEPCPDFLQRLTESEFMPCNEDFFNLMGGRYGLTIRHIICNGPFYVSYWDPENSMTIKANKYYAGAQSVLPTSVSIQFGNDNATLLKKLSTSALSAAFLSPDAETPEKTAAEKTIINTVYGFVFNCADEALKNANLRKAMCMSVDRSLFTVPGDNVYPQSGLIPESCSAGADSYRKRVGLRTPVIAYDTEKAASLWTKGTEKLETVSVPVTILCPEEFDSALRSQLQIWQKLFGLSFAATITTMTGDEIRAAVSNGEYQIAFTAITAGQNDAVSFLSELNETNPFNYNSSKYNGIIERLKSVTSDEDILNGCYTAEDYLLKQGVCFPLYSKAARLVVADGVTGIAMPGSESTVSFIGARRFD